MDYPQAFAIGINVSASETLAAVGSSGHRSSGTSQGMRPEIATLLSQLKRRIRGYVLIEGIALLAVLVGGMFWLTLTLDWAYFRLTALELPLWFREAIAVLSVALLAAGAIFWIVLRFFARLRARALALVLERRFPQLGSRMITAVEMAESRSGQDSSLTAAMIERTIDDAVRLSAALPLESVFDRAPLRRSLAAAVLLFGAIGTFALIEPTSISRWGRAFIQRDAVYWPRETELVVKAVIQPGDRIRDFVEGRLKHPRGVDLVLLVEAAEGKKVPDAVELNYVLDAGRGSSRVEMVKGRDGQFRHTISGLLDSVSLSVSGGDYTTRTPLRVDVVDAPRLDKVTLDCDYPDYTGLDRDSDGKVVRHVVEVQGSQVALPMETSFVFRGRANKPLTAVRIETDSRRIVLSRSGASSARRTASGELGAEQPLANNSPEPVLSADGYDAILPFVLTSKERSSKADPTLAGTATKTNQHQTQNAGGLPIAIPTDCRMRIELEDVDGITSVEPIRVAINGIADQPPAIQTELRGIGLSITRKAVIPVIGTITDDYGVAKAQFEYRIGKETERRVLPFRRAPAGNPKEYVFRRNESDRSERFEVLPLELPVGQRLTLCVTAEDGDNLNGPHLSRGEQYVFQIVSDEELLSLLYVKEVNLRERFEKIIGELENVQKDLIAHRNRAKQSVAGGQDAGGNSPKNGGPIPERDSESFGDLRTAVAVCAVRSLHQVRTNSVETGSVEESFQSLLEELVNNAVHTQTMVDRISLRIVGPLHTANEKDFPSADQAIGLFKLAVDGGQDAVPQIDSSIRAVSTLIAHLKIAMNEMQDLVKFHDAIGRLQAMIKEQEKISDSTRQEQKKKRLKELRGLQ